MARKHPRAYPTDFRQKVVELARAGRQPDDLAHEFGLARQTVRNWIKQFDLDSGSRSDGLTSEERAELFKLRKQVKQLTIEREILSKAAVDSTGQRNSKPAKLPQRGRDGSSRAPGSFGNTKARALDAMASGRINE